MTRWLIVVAIILTAGTATAAVPKYQWTPAQASAQIMRWQPAIYYPASDPDPADIRSVRCGGKGPAVNGRYLSFRCVTVFAQHTVNPTPEAKVLWVKVRRQGAGQPCVSLVSLAAVPAGCLRTVGSRIRGDENDAEHAVRERSGSSLSVQCVGHGAGYYLCTWGNDRAAVAFSPTKVSVTLLT